MKTRHKIKAEMKGFSSDRFDSILRDTVEPVKHFHWDSAGGTHEDAANSLDTAEKFDNQTFWA